MSARKISRACRNRIALIAPLVLIPPCAGTKAGAQRAIGCILSPTPSAPANLQHALQRLRLGVLRFRRRHLCPFLPPAQCTDRTLAFVLDGLLGNESDLKIEEHYTDTHARPTSTSPPSPCWARFCPRVRGVRHRHVTGSISATTAATLTASSQSRGPGCRHRSESKLVEILENSSNSCISDLSHQTPWLSPFFGLYERSDTDASPNQLRGLI